MQEDICVTGLNLCALMEGIIRTCQDLIDDVGHGFSAVVCMISFKIRYYPASAILEGSGTPVFWSRVTWKPELEARIRSSLIWC